MEAVGTRVCCFWMVMGLVVAGSVAWAGIELKFGVLRLRNLDIEYSTNLTEWSWWGTLQTTNTGPMATLTMVESVTNAPARFWRVTERTNL